MVEERTPYWLWWLSSKADSLVWKWLHEGEEVCGSCRVMKRWEKPFTEKVPQEQR